MSQPFWNFSLAVYGAGAVQDECLKLQDQFGLDVNLVLLCAFLGAVHGATVTPDDVAAARREVRAWQDDVVHKLRAARRSLKTIGLAPDTKVADAATKLRTLVKAAELEAEHIEQTMLERWAMARLAGRPRGAAPDAVLANLQVLTAAYGIGRDRLSAADAMQQLIAVSLKQVADAGRPRQ
jgi:uncharacterized protein (TIGR02444 family)